MNMLKDYDVLRLIEHNRICYVSSDNVRGYPLVRWIKFHPYLSKGQMERWIQDIIRQLVQIHKCRGNPSYQYVNPYSIIVTEEGKLCFLDIGAVSNRDRIRMMHRRNIKDFFCLPDDMYCENEENLDIYGFGKTVQYLLAFVEVEPEFTKKEEKRLRKMIERCINHNRRKRFHTISDVQKCLIELKIA